MDLDLGQVRAFVAAADLGTFGRAAESLFVTQQALSKRIARLEEVVGPLFERGHAGVVLTGRGERFLPAARELLAAGEDAVAAARDAPVAGMRIDVWGHLHPLLELVRAFAARHRDADVEISMRRSLPRALDALARDELDVASGNLASLWGAPPGVAAALVTCTPLAALVAAAGPLAGAEVLAPGDLRRAGLWWPERSSSTELVAFAHEYADAIGAPLDGDGVNLGLESLVENLARDPARVTLVGADWPVPPDAPVRAVPVRPVPYYPWYAVWRRRTAHPLVPALVRSLRASGSVPDPDDPGVWLPARARAEARVAAA